MAKHAKQRQSHKAGLVGGHSEGGGAEKRERKKDRKGGRATLPVASQ